MIEKKQLWKKYKNKYK